MIDPLGEAAGQRKEAGRPPVNTREGGEVVVRRDGVCESAADNLTTHAGEPQGPRSFVSLLFEGTPAAGAETQEDRSFASDLNLDQIIESIAGGREEHDLIATLLYRQLHDVDTVHYRQEVFRDLADRNLLGRLRQFAEVMRQVRAHLVQVEKMQYQYQREGWFLDAAALYCDAICALAADLASARLESRALLRVREFLSDYVSSADFASLVRDTKDRKDVLAEICYCIRIRGGRVDVTRYEGEADYSAEVLETFERFKQGAAKDYRVMYRTWPGMDHVGAQVLQLVARLFPGEFSALDEYCSQHGTFFDETIRCFERELQFYLAYLDYIGPLRSAGLTFCCPDVTTESKEIFATNTFDLALAKKLASRAKPIVRNDFHLTGPERIFVVSGPNQGGKTTFARTFGQLHHLASVGCPVPGDSARLFLFDRIFTHFEREEDLTKMSGKLEDDLIRIREVLETATTNSVVIMNEIFTSTTLDDARFLGTKVLKKIIELDLLCIYVTFVDELAALGESVVSMVSTIIPNNPAERTYKVVRGPADGLAYALAIAEKYHLTRERLHERLVS